MDGIKWKNVGSEDGYTIWKQDIVAQPYATPDGLNPIMLEGQYHDLDLLLMGVKNAGEPYKASNRYVSMVRATFDCTVRLFCRTVCCIL